MFFFDLFGISMRLDFVHGHAMAAQGRDQNGISRNKGSGKGWSMGLLCLVSFPGKAWAFLLTSHISCFKKVQGCCGGGGEIVAKNINSHFPFLCGFAVSDSLGCPWVSLKEEPRSCKNVCLRQMHLLLKYSPFFYDLLHIPAPLCWRTAHSQWEGLF